MLLEMFYDTSSPYAFLCFEALLKYQKLWEPHQVKMSFRPYFLGGVIKASSNSIPFRHKAKGAYNNEDLPRSARYWGVELQQPKDIEVLMGSLRAQRLLAACEMTQPDHLIPLTRCIWGRIWQRDEDITTEESLTEACREAGLSPSQSSNLLLKSNSVEAKDWLKRNTQDAIDRGAFGAPWMTVKVTGEHKWHPFFGADSLPRLAHCFDLPWLGPRGALGHPASRL
ncbi:unnamed protein product [Chrysoparadoxa australica]